MGETGRFSGPRTDGDDCTERLVCAPKAVLKEMELWELMNRDMEKALGSGEGRTGLDFLISGSRAEGLRLDTAWGLHSDLDIMVILPSWTTCHNSCRNSRGTDGHVWTLDVQNAPPGYTRIKATGKMDDLISNDNFVTSKLQDWSQHLRSIHGLNLGKAEPHGPALRTQFDSFQLDYVPTLVFHTELPEISTWIERERFSNWPPENVINCMKNLPTLVVPVGHHRSLEPQKEWRISYSQAEMGLCRTISGVARSAYTRFKNLIKNELYHNGLSGITSYHLKTTLLWVLEEHGNDYDQEDEVVTKLLHKLRYFLHKGRLPQYFNPNINLIDSQDKVNISELRQILSRLMPTRHSQKRTVDTRLIVTFGEDGIAIGPVKRTKNYIVVYINTKGLTLIIHDVQKFTRKKSRFNKSWSSSANGG